MAQPFPMLLVVTMGSFAAILSTFLNIKTENEELSESSMSSPVRKVL
jgi:hypothetical protein